MASRDELGSEGVSQRFDASLGGREGKRCYNDVHFLTWAADLHPLPRATQFRWRALFWVTGQGRAYLAVWLGAGLEYVDGSQKPE